MIKIQFASKKEHDQTFAQITPSDKIALYSVVCRSLMISLEAILFLVSQSPYFELKHSDSRRAYRFGCQADDTTDKK